jgi:glycosyltransferase involved in cell wall biosynthesis
MNQRAKIAFLTSLDPTNKKSWSGILYNMANSLQKHCGDVHFIGPVPSPIKPIKFFGALSYFSRKLLNKRIDYYHTHWLAKMYASFFQKKIALDAYDLIFVVPSSSLFAFLETDTPIIYCSDATFHCMLNYYPVYSNLFAFSEKEAMGIEKQALNKANLLLFPSSWATNSAIQNLGCSPEQTFVIPLGANLEKIPSAEEIFNRPKSQKCRLLFIGVEWERKGGPIAFETLLYMEKMGIETELTICGCVPPASFSHRNLRVIPYLDKNDSKDCAILFDLFLNTDFFFLPTRADFFGIVFCEASAFGIPSIATNTGGVSGAVKDGVNGFLLPLEARGEDYATLISTIFSNKEQYLTLRKSSRQLFEDQLNWDKWGQEVNKLINEKIFIAQ